MSNNSADREEGGGLQQIIDGNVYRGQLEQVPVQSNNDDGNKKKTASLTSDKGQDGHKRTLGALLKYSDEVLSQSKRIIRKTILDEDTYDTAIGELVERDFFPHHKKMRLQKEYLQASQVNDHDKLQDIMNRYFELEKHQQDMQNIQAMKRKSILERTHAGAGYKGQSIDAAVDHLTLGEFFQRYISEDDASFELLKAKEKRKHRDENKWMYRLNSGSGTNKGVVQNNSLKLTAGRSSSSNDTKEIENVNVTPLTHTTSKCQGGVVEYKQANDECIDLSKDAVVCIDDDSQEVQSNSSSCLVLYADEIQLPLEGKANEGTTRSKHSKSAMLAMAGVQTIYPENTRLHFDPFKRPLSKKNENSSSSQAYNNDKTKPSFEEIERNRIHPSGYAMPTMRQEQYNDIVEQARYGTTPSSSNNNRLIDTAGSSSSSGRGVENTYKDIVSPSPARHVYDEPVMTWGSIDSTPLRLVCGGAGGIDGGYSSSISSSGFSSYTMPKETENDRAGLILLEKSKSSCRSSKQKRVKSGRDHSSRIKGPTASSITKLASMSPAARRLIENTGGIPINKGQGHKGGRLKDNREGMMAVDSALRKTYSPRRD